MKQKWVDFSLGTDWGGVENARTNVNNNETKPRNATLIRGLFWLQTRIPVGVRVSFRIRVRFGVWVSFRVRVRFGVPG